MIIESIILGILQGILEWLPISSEGNLVLIMIVFFGIEEGQALSLSVYLHIGTLFAVLVYFRREIINLLKALPSYHIRDSSNAENKLISFVLLTTILTSIVGYLIFKLAEITSMLGEAFTAIIGIALIITGILQKLTKRLKRRTIENVNFTDALLLGVVQGFSAFPGISRSGITTATLLFRGFRSDHALNLSFLMSIPAVSAAEIGLILMKGFPAINAIDLALGCTASFVAGLISIHILMKLAQKINFWIFCILIGLLAFLPILSYL